MAACSAIDGAGTPSRLKRGQADFTAEPGRHRPRLLKATPTIDQKRLQRLEDL